MRGGWAIAVLVACAPAERFEIPSQAGASFITFSRVGAQAPVLEAHTTAPTTSPFVAQPGEIEIGVLAYDRPLAELGLVEGPIPDAPERFPFRALPRPTSAWSIKSGDPLRTFASELPEAVRLARIRADGCSELVAEKIFLPESSGEIRILSQLDAHRLFVGTVVTFEHHDGEWKWFTITDGDIRPITVHAPFELHGFFPSERGCVWLTRSSTMAACFGPTSTATVWDEQDRIELPRLASVGGAIIGMDGVDREGERELYILTALGRVFRATTSSVGVLDPRVSEIEDFRPRVLHYLGPGHVVVTHGPILTQYRDGQPPRERPPPPEIGELIAISAPTPLGTLVTSDSGPSSGIAVFDQATGALQPFKLAYGGTDYILSLHFNDVTPVLDTLLMPGDRGTLLELVPFERDLDGAIVGWDLCPPTQIANSSLFQVVPQGTSVWIGGNEATYDFSGRSAVFRVRRR